MRITITDPLDDAYIETAWKQAETEEIEDLTAGLLARAPNDPKTEDELFDILYLAFRCGFKTAVGNIRICMRE